MGATLTLQPIQPEGALFVVRSSSARQVIVSLLAAAAWLVVLWMCLNPPGPDESMRLPFFAVLGLAVGASSLAAFPWMMVGYVRDQTLAYVAGYMHREADEEPSRPDLRIVGD